MISIIISSQDKAMLEMARINVRETIGVPFEIIVIENSQGEMGICKAYNTGAKKAAFDILCFMHEDIYFETAGWGQRVIDHLSDPSIGLIGVAGGDTKSLVPSSWSSFVFVSEISLVQHFKRESRPPERISRTGYPDDTSPAKPVTCIDGVWMCTRKDVFSHHQFDEKTFSGFHAYDIDFSLEVSTRYRVCVISDIGIHHFSEGSFNRTWMENAIKLSDKWRKTLPRSVRPLSRKEYVNQHWTSMRNFINKMVELDYNLYFIFTHFLKYSFTRHFHFKHFLHFIKEILLKKVFANKASGK